MKAPGDPGGSSGARPGFNYDAIPEGYYDRVVRDGHPVRRLWHVSKFERVLDYLPPEGGGSLLDVGCFAGTFLSMVPRYRFERQVGADILPQQVAYANHHHGTAFRSFVHVEGMAGLAEVGSGFEWVTLIEVIEHLRAEEIRGLFDAFDRLLAPKGHLVVTTPNYASSWPLLELALNRFSDLSYEEQHVTRFSFFNFERRLAEVVPGVWQRYRLELKTTTHFMMPFLATLSYEVARGVARAVPHKSWKHPFGNLLLAVLSRRGEDG